MSHISKSSTTIPPGASATRTPPKTPPRAASPLFNARPTEDPAADSPFDDFFADASDDEAVDEKESTREKTPSPTHSSSTPPKASSKQNSSEEDEKSSSNKQIIKASEILDEKSALALSGMGLQLGNNSFDMLNHSLINPNAQGMLAVSKSISFSSELGAKQMLETTAKNVQAGWGLRKNMNAITDDLTNKVLNSKSAAETNDNITLILNTYVAESNVHKTVTINALNVNIATAQSTKAIIDSQSESMKTALEAFTLSEKAMDEDYDRRLDTLAKQMDLAIEKVKKKGLSELEVKAELERIERINLRAKNKIENARAREASEIELHRQEEEIKQLEQKKKLEDAPFILEYNAAIADYKRQRDSTDEVVKNSKSYNIYYTPPEVIIKPDGSKSVKFGKVSYTAISK